MPLNPDDYSFLANRAVWQQKQAIDASIKSQLEASHRALASVHATQQANYPDSLRTALALDAKLARGNNYKGCPYMLLDYPRQFAGQDWLAFRVLVLWGHFVGVFLLLKDHGVQQWKLPSGLPEHWWLRTHGDPWVWERLEGDYLAVRLSENEKAGLASADFVRLGRYLPFSALENLPEQACQCWTELALGFGE